MSVPVLVFGRRDHGSLHTMRSPAAEKRQGTKSREVRHRPGSGGYGDLMPAPMSMMDGMPGRRQRHICTCARSGECCRHFGGCSERINA